ncbi:hypothetical protein C8J56DRAFT_951373 [Mycena floridula]|nr:hypothetical protein C8J56DRAFT_951373 [Mycena floridula]
MHEEESASALYYLVPTEHGRRKRIIRRARPPLTSVPLHDDFDAATIARLPLQEDNESPRLGGNQSPSLQRNGSPSRWRNGSVWVSEEQYGLDPTAGGSGQQAGWSERQGNQLSLEPRQRKRAPSHTTSRNGSLTRPPVEYKIIANHILEDTSDKTVSISTWRETVAKETRESAAMSVYYLRAEDAKEHNEGRSIESLKDPVERQRAQSTSALPQSPSPKLSEKKGLPFPSGSSIHRQINDSFYRSSSINDPGDSRIHVNGSRNGSLLPHNSTPLDDLLSTCFPSLLHLIPILSRLGIHDIDHLRAVAALTPVTRDREVREFALQYGMTVVEWAVFLDRIKRL